MIHLQKTVYTFKIEVQFLGCISVISDNIPKWFATYVIDAMEKQPT